jgi:hypothetical protein
MSPFPESRRGPRLAGAAPWAGLLVLVLAALGLAGDAPQRDAAEPHNFGIGGTPDSEVPEDPRDSNMRERDSYPVWSVSKEMPNDMFTFARLRYPSAGGRGYYRRGHKWLTDYPDSDLNFSYRLQQVTSLQVNPKGAIVDIKADQLRHYPFVYMLEIGEIDLSDDEARILRDYMLNGGFIMVDDNWGGYEWTSWLRAIKQMFPDRDMKELALEHEIFNIVFKLDKIPQIPGVHAFMRGYDYEDHGPESKGAHYYGVYDDKGRMVMCVCHNTDLGDGWEEEGTDPRYFQAYSEKYAYPLGINIIFYAMTH